jgi:hypothetical protein
VGVGAPRRRGSGLQNLAAVAESRGGYRYREHVSGDSTGNVGGNSRTRCDDWHRCVGLFTTSLDSAPGSRCRRVGKGFRTPTQLPFGHGLHSIRTIERELKVPNSTGTRASYYPQGPWKVKRPLKGPEPGHEGRCLSTRDGALWSQGRPIPPSQTDIKGKSQISDDKPEAPTERQSEDDRECGEDPVTHHSALSGKRLLTVKLRGAQKRPIKRHGHTISSAPAARNHPPFTVPSNDC